jgi:hypothetical protein
MHTLAPLTRGTNSGRQCRKLYVRNLNIHSFILLQQTRAGAPELSLSLVSLGTWYGTCGACGASSLVSFGNYGTCGNVSLRYLRYLLCVVSVRTGRIIETPEFRNSTPVGVFVPELTSEIRRYFRTSALPSVMLHCYCARSECGHHRTTEALNECRDSIVVETKTRQRRQAATN